MKHLVALLLVILFSCSATPAGYSIPPEIFLRAWSDAVKASEIPKKYTTRPPLTMWEPKWVVEQYCQEDESGEEQCGFSRILGYYQNRLVVTKGGHVKLKEKIVLLISLEEHQMCPKLLYELLVHEFLHYLHLRLVLLDENFLKEHPDEHEWIDEVYDFQARCWWEEEDEEETGDSVDASGASGGSTGGKSTDSEGCRRKPRPKF